MDDDDKFDLNVCKDNYEFMQTNNLDMAKLGRREEILYKGQVQRKNIRNFEERRVWRI